jgi:hypothetical protein
MAKFYIESADIKKVIDAKTPFGACVKTLSLYLSEAQGSGGGSVTIGEYFVVSERGFSSSRPNREINTINEVAIDSREVFEELKNE